jgi:hypothetical protein
LEPAAFDIRNHQINNHSQPFTPSTMASSQNTTKKDDKAAAATQAEQQQPAAEQKPAPLEEDDEFEDFPVDGASTQQHARG